MAAIDSATRKLAELRALLDRMIDVMERIGWILGWVGLAGAIGGALIWLSVLLVTNGDTPARPLLLVLFAVAPAPGLFLLWWRRTLLAATGLRDEVARRIEETPAEIGSVVSDLPSGLWRRLLVLAWRARRTVGSLSGLALDLTPVLKLGNPWALLALVLAVPWAIAAAMVAPVALGLAAVW